MSAGQWIWSAAVTATFTNCLHEAELPAASVAVHVRVVVPTGYGSVNAFPSPRWPITMTPGQLSVATAGVTGTMAEHCPASVPVVMSAGHWIRGCSVSFTLILNVHVRRLPALSTAVQVTVVVPTGKKAPDGGVQTMVGMPELPVTKGRGYWTCAPHFPGSV